LWYKDMRWLDPLHNWLTATEQKMLLYVGAMILLGCILQATNLVPVPPAQPAVDSLLAVTEKDAPVNLDIRNAGKEELMTLPGIGEKRAGDIIAFREQHPFKSVNDLLQVKGIGGKTYAKLLPYLLVFGDSLNLEAVSKAEHKAKTSTKTKDKPLTKSAMTNVVNINTAGLEELCTLAGIGEVKARAIIAWREANGGFAKVEDLTQVKGIGAKTLERNLKRLCVSGK